MHFHAICIRQMPILLMHANFFQITLESMLITHTNADWNKRTPSFAKEEVWD